MGTKQIWLITYGASCPSITHAALWERHVHVDECYTAAWRESKYTLVHLPKRQRVTPATMQAAVDAMPDVILSGIVGFDPIACNDAQGTLETHPGFMHIVHVLNTEPAQLEVWLQAMPLVEHRKGLLWKHLESVPPEEMTRAQLIRRTRRNEARCKELEALYADALHRIAIAELAAKLHEELAALAIERANECVDMVVAARRKASTAAQTDVTPPSAAQTEDGWAECGGPAP